MSPARASLVPVEDAITIVTAALDALVRRRASIDAPVEYVRRVAHPWTDDLAFELALQIDAAQTGGELQPMQEVSTAFRRVARDAPEMKVRLVQGLPHTIRWRIYAPDDSALLEQPVALHSQWRGAWPHLSRACDDLAQTRASLRVLATQADPDRDVDGLTLATACAYRISAFAPPREPVLLAFYAPEGGWRSQAGFSLYSYKTGEQAVTPLAPG
tara:strand:+ start:271 stop:915 length:645 start_codon:yes stop_codon:yes gene_type:complete